MKRIDDPEQTDCQNQPKKFPTRVLWLVLLLFIAISFLILLYFGQDLRADTSAQYTFIAAAFLNVLIITAIVAQAVIYYAQWAVMARQGNLMEQQTRILERSVKAAEDAANVAKQTMILTNRAYVFPDKWSAIVHEPGQVIPYARLVVSCDIRNNGKVPATIDWIEHRIGSQELRETSGVMLFPDSEPLSQEFSTHFDPTIHSLDKHWTLILTGTIRYRDEFRRRDRFFHRVIQYIPGDPSGEGDPARVKLHVPESKLNNEREYADDEEDEWEQLQDTLDKDETFPN